MYIYTCDGLCGFMCLELKWTSCVWYVYYCTNMCVCVCVYVCVCVCVVFIYCSLLMVMLLVFAAIGQVCQVG